MKSVVSSVNIPVTVIVSQIGVLNARLGYFTISGMASAGHKYQLRFFNLTYKCYKKSATDFHTNEKKIANH